MFQTTNQVLLVLSIHFEPALMFKKNMSTMMGIIPRLLLVWTAIFIVTPKK
jgi:hypothetical protein